MRILNNRISGLIKAFCFRDSRPAVFMGRPLSPNPDKDWNFSLDMLPQEYPGFGTGDFRTPAFQIMQEDGSTTCDLRFHSYRIIQGKPKLEGLPAIYTESDDEAETLEIELKDNEFKFLSPELMDGPVQLCLVFIIIIRLVCEKS